MKLMKFLLLLVIVTLLVNCKTSREEGFSKKDFIAPPMQYWPRPLYFWNNTTVEAGVLLSQMQAMKDKCGYGGFGVVPFGKDFRPAYLSEDYLSLYGKMLGKAKELGMTLSLYDEYGFPSGSVGAFREGDDTPRFQMKYPDLTIQRLDKSEEAISGPSVYTANIPGGKLMGAVAMDLKEMKRIDISGSVIGGKLKWIVPPGKWRIMIFTCVIDGTPLADYLNPVANEKFTGMVHDVYYGRFRQYFGNVIYGTFFDEPSMFHARFRMWTPLFNEKFEAKYGFSPVTLYPAMWYDIGPETGAARNYLFGFRAELYSGGFTKVVNDWSVAHGITATGHSAPEEAIVPANSSGDVMKAFRYLEIPGIDKIGGSRYAEKFYKLISSSACNWDRRLVMSETYGAMPDYDKPGDLSWNDIWSIAIDQYTKGINMLIPHAVWYDNTRVTYKPELSWRNPLYADSLRSFTMFLSRLNYILQQEGRHVADIALLYPVHTLLGEHWFYTEKGPANIDGWVDPANRFYYDAIKRTDYVDIAGLLTNVAGKDFTFIHPEVLDEKCTVNGNILTLENKTNRELFKAIIVPSCELISVSNMKKIAGFFSSGGTVIFTTRLPARSAETGKDSVVQAIVKSLFRGAVRSDSIVVNENGGKACFLESIDGKNLTDVLQKSLVSFDVEYSPNSDLQYIHKVAGNRNIYFFGNKGGRAVETEVRLNGKLRLEKWDPHTGKIQDARCRSVESRISGTFTTIVDLTLEQYHSVFLVEDI
jgi:hypothetical protein